MSQGLLLSLTLMNMVAIGLCIYGSAASQEPDDLTTGKSEGKLSVRQGIDTGVKAESPESRPGVVAEKPEHAAKTIEPSNLSNAVTSSEVMHFLDKEILNEVVVKSTKLIDNYKKRVLPAVETINDKITRALHLEKYLDSYTSTAVGALDSLICPTETPNDKQKPVADTGVQVSVSKLAKPLHRKNKFFHHGARSHVFRTVDFFSHGTTFKYSTLHYWNNRKKMFLRKLRKKHKPVEEPQKALPPNLLVDMSSQDEALLEGSNSQPMCQDSVHDKIDNFDGSSFSLMCETSNGMKDEEGQTMNQIVEPRTTNNDGTCFTVTSDIQNPSVNDNIDNVNGSPSNMVCETSIGSLDNKSQISPRTGSEESCFMMASDMQSPSVNINIDHLNDNSFLMKCGSSIGSLDNLQQLQSQISSRTGSGVASEIISWNDFMRQDVTVKPHDTVVTTVISANSSTNSLELTSTALTTLEARKCRDKRALGINSILEMLDPRLDQKNIVENLCLLILKIFDAWSETQLSVVPSKGSITPSSSKKCIDYISQRNSSSALVDVVPATKKGECSDLTALLNRNYSTLIATVHSKYSDAKQVETPAQIRLECQQENSQEVSQSVVNDIVEEILTRTPESMEMPTYSYQSNSIPDCNQSMEQLDEKVTEQEEQPSTANKDEMNGPENEEYSESSANVSSSVNEWNNDLGVIKHPLADGNSTIETSGIHQNVEELTKKNLRASSEETFYSWAPESSSEDPSFHEFDVSMDSLVTPDNLVTVCEGIERPDSRQRPVSKNEDKGCSSRDAISTHSLASIGFPLVLKSSSIDSWVLKTTSGDGIEIRHVRSAMKSEEMSEESYRAVPFDLTDGESGSDAESNTSLVTTGTSDASSDVLTRKKWGSQHINKFKKKRPKTPRSGSAGTEPPSQAQSDCGMKTSESYIHHNASLSDEN